MKNTETEDKVFLIEEYNDFYYVRPEFSKRIVIYKVKIEDIENFIKSQNELELAHKKFSNSKTIGRFNSLKEVDEFLEGFYYGTRYTYNKNVEYSIEPWEIYKAEIRNWSPS